MYFGEIHHRGCWSSASRHVRVCTVICTVFLFWGDPPQGLLNTAGRHTQTCTDVCTEMYTGALGTQQAGIFGFELRFVLPYIYTHIYTRAIHCKDSWTHIGSRADIYIDIGTDFILTCVGTFITLTLVLTLFRHL